MKVRAVSECKILIETFKVEEGDVIHSRGYRTDGIFQKTHSSFKVNVIRPGSTGESQTPPTTFVFTSKIGDSCTPLI